MNMKKMEAVDAQQVREAAEGMLVEAQNPIDFEDHGVDNPLLRINLQVLEDAINHAGPANAREQFITQAKLTQQKAAQAQSGNAKSVTLVSPPPQC